jgi:chemotaxis protein histidine kinase CheA
MAATAASDSFFARIGEYFTLSGAQAAQAKLGEPARKAMDQALSVGRQRADAAESLWSNGHTAEGLRLAVAALHDTLAAAPAYGAAMRLKAAAPKAAPAEAEVEAKAEPKPKDEEKAEPKEDEKAEAKAEAEEAEAEAKPEAQSEGEEAKADAAKADAAKADAAKADEAKADAEEANVAVEAAAKAADASPASDDDAWSEALLARGTKKAHVEKVRAALASAKKAELPTLDADVSAAHADLFQQVLDARHLVDRSFGMVALPPRDLSWTRFSRIGTTVVVSLLGVTGLYFGLRTPEGVFADASDVWAQSPTFAPETVIDGNDDSYWLLPDGAGGWVEARISPPADVTRIRVLNTHNPPHNDRATRDYAIEVYSGGEVARTIEGSFEFSANPEFVTHDVGVDHVERIRFVVRSHHNVGGGLAELQWE